MDESNVVAQLPSDGESLASAQRLIEAYYKQVRKQTSIPIGCSYGRDPMGEVRRCVMTGHYCFLLTRPSAVHNGHKTTPVTPVTDWQLFWRANRLHHRVQRAQFTPLPTRRGLWPLNH